MNRVPLRRLPAFRDQLIEALAAIGITNSTDLLSTTGHPEMRRELAHKLHIELAELDRLVTVCDLMRLNGIGPSTAVLLGDLTNVRTVQDLAVADPAQILEQVKRTEHELVYPARAPSVAHIAEWKQQAQEMQALVGFYVEESPAYVEAHLQKAFQTRLNQFLNSAGCVGATIASLSLLLAIFWSVLAALAWNAARKNDLASLTPEMSPLSVVAGFRDLGYFQLSLTLACFSLLGFGLVVAMVLVIAGWQRLLFCIEYRVLCRDNVDRRRLLVLEQKLSPANRRVLRIVTIVAFILLAISGTTVITHNEMVETLIHITVGVLTFAGLGVLAFHLLRVRQGGTAQEAFDGDLLAFSQSVSIGSTLVLILVLLSVFSLFVAGMNEVAELVLVRPMTDAYTRATMLLTASSWSENLRVGPLRIITGQWQAVVDYAKGMRELNSAVEAWTRRDLALYLLIAVVVGFVTPFLRFNRRRAALFLGLATASYVVGVALEAVLPSTFAVSSKSLTGVFFLLSFALVAEKFFDEMYERTAETRCACYSCQSAISTTVRFCSHCGAPQLVRRSEIGR